jgi:hypothetical protein
MMKCPECGTTNPANARFCGACAAPLDSSCARCGEDNPRGARFCGGCGAGLSARATAMPHAAQQTTDVPLVAPGTAAQGTAATGDDAGFLSHIPLAPPFEEEPALGAVAPTGPEPAAPPSFERPGSPASPPPGAPASRRAQRKTRLVLGLVPVVGVLILLGVVTEAGLYLGRGSNTQKSKALPTPAAVSPVVPKPPAAAPAPVQAPKRNPAPLPSTAPMRRTRVIAHELKPMTTAVPLRRDPRPPAISYHNRRVAKPKAPGKEPLTAAQKQALHRKQALQTARRSEAILKARAEKFRREHADVPPAASSGSDSQ